MSTHTATARAHPNIAFIKYWGNRDDDLRLPANSSISMNLEGLETRTSVQFEASLKEDEITINGKMVGGATRERVCRMLDEIRTLAGIRPYARVNSKNNFPTGTGIASSASAFAALAMAASAAAGLSLTSIDLSRLARHGSGSACRSIPGGFVEWTAGTSDADSYAISFAPPEHWDLTDCIAVISAEHKQTSSTEGHALAETSSLQSARVDDTPRRINICRQAILDHDFSTFAEIVEEDSNLMHAVMMTSHPPLFYWKPPTLAVIQTVRLARANGLQVCYTIDAGPNVHVICTKAAEKKAAKLIGSIPGVRQVLQAKVGGPARMENPPTGID